MLFESIQSRKCKENHVGSLDLPFVKPSENLKKARKLILNFFWMRQNGKTDCTCVLHTTAMNFNSVSEQLDITERKRLNSNKWLPAITT